MDIAQLNRDFAIEGQLRLIEGTGGLPFIEIDNDRARALISVYAGQVLAYRPHSEPEDLLFLSDKAYYQSGKAIKGGIPICWPWFGADPQGLDRPSHGFARNRQWRVVGTETTPEGSTKVALELSDTEDSRALWPHAFTLTLEISIGSDLQVELITRNKGDTPFTITQALHTYFRVGDIARVRVLGLENLHYLDKVDEGAEKTQTGAVLIGEEVDRIYTGVNDPLTIDDAALGRRIQISAAGSRSAVVWNPWAKIAAGMADLEDEDYLRMLCVETANAADDRVEVPAGSDARLLARYSILRD